MESAAASTPVERRAVVLPTLLIGLAFCVAAVVLLWDAGWYQVFKVVHVGFAVVWIGGGVLITLLGVRAELASDPQQRVWLGRQLAFVGRTVFAPSSLIVLASGIAMVVDVDWGWDRFWVVFGLFGFAWSFAAGVGVIAPAARKLERLVHTAGPDAPESQATLARILLVARIDFAVLLLVVIAMIVKPFS